MEVLPASTANGVGRLPFRSDLLWRYPVPQSPQMDLRNQLPNSLGNDPRQWSRESVAAFLQWCQYEFDLPQFNMDKFQMNGKALCLLTKADLAERSPGSGDVLHNVLQMLVHESSLLHGGSTSPLATHFPRHHWPAMVAPDPLPLRPNPHLQLPHHQPPPISTPGPPPPVSFSVTLSPVPSGKSVLSGATPPHSSSPSGNSICKSNSNQGSNKPVTIAPHVPLLTVSPVPQSVSPDLHEYSHMRTEDESEMQSSAEHSPVSFGHAPMPGSPVYRRNDLSPSSLLKQSSVSTNTPPHSPVHKMAQFTLNSEPVLEPNSNGRLLWDFLQQLLNDSQQRYTAYIAWKNRDIGVFKIVDPPGLAKLWGIQKNHLSMNYDKMSRALRYYYRVNILRKVQGERHCYQFLRNPSELRSIKNISLLRQQMPPAQQAYSVKTEPQEQSNDVQDDLQPTDLSKGGSSNGSNPSTNSSSGNGGSSQAQQQDMKLQLNMWTQQDSDVKSEPDSNNSTVNLSTTNVIKTEDST